MEFQRSCVFLSKAPSYFFAEIILGGICRIRNSRKIRSENGLFDTEIHRETLGNRQQAAKFSRSPELGIFGPLAFQADSWFSASRALDFLEKKQETRKTFFQNPPRLLTGVPGGIRTHGLSLRRWTQCIYSLSTGIKKMQLYQGFSPCSL